MGGWSSLPHTVGCQDSRSTAGGLTDATYRGVTNINGMTTSYTTSRDLTPFSSAAREQLLKVVLSSHAAQANGTLSAIHILSASTLGV